MLVRPRATGPDVSRGHPCEIRHSPLDCHCNSGVNRLFRRGIHGKRLLTGERNGWLRLFAPGADEADVDLGGVSPAVRVGRDVAEGIAALVRTPPCKLRAIYLCAGSIVEYYIGVS